MVPGTVAAVAVAAAVAIEATVVDRTYTVLPVAMAIQTGHLPVPRPRWRARLAHWTYPCVYPPV